MKGVYPRPSAHDRFFSKVEKTDSCWIWKASTNKFGYGQFRYQGKMVKAHRFIYEKLKSKIPKGKQLDHLCRVRRCVNPDHLEIVTPRENVTRSAKFHRVSDLPTGVAKHSRKYRSSKKFKSDFCYIGLFNTAEEASIAYQTAILGQNKIKKLRRKND